MATTQTSSTSSTSSSSANIKDQTFNGLGNLIRLLPTGTVFFYQFLNPILTNNGSCSTTNKIVSSLLFAVCGLSCFFSTFTDSYKDDQGKIHYGTATFSGFWPVSTTSTASMVDFKSYRLKLGDFVHAALGFFVFCVLSLLDSNTVQCFYPSFESTQKALLMALPPIIGAIFGSVFAAFPCDRHGVGYPTTSTSTSSSTSPSSNTTTTATSTPSQPANGAQKV